MLWVACCLGFFGFLRTEEMTVPSDSAFDPSVHLSYKDIALSPWEGRSGPIQVLWSQFPYRGCNGSSRKRYGRFCYQNPGKVAGSSIFGVHPQPKRTIGTLFKIVMFIISNCGCLYSAIGVVRVFNYYREKRRDAWLGCLWGVCVCVCVCGGGGGGRHCCALGRVLGGFTPIIPTHPSHSCTP